VIENTWLFPAVEVLHVIGMAWLLGPVLLGDLSVLGWVPRIQPGQMSRVALGLVLVTGALLFTANSGRYLRNPAFLLKMGLLAAAMGAHATVHGREKRTTAALSLVLWSLVILSGRAVIDFDV
jgi:hypothetical protein